MWRGWFVFLIALICVDSSVALAKPGRRSRDPLNEAKRLYSRLRYEEARPKLRRALEGDLSPGRRLEALALLGTIEIILDDHEAARGHFTELLRLDPGYQLDPGLSPKILDVFTLLQRQLYPPQSARFVQAPRVDMTVAGAAEVVTLIDGSGGPLRVRCHHRRAPAAAGSASAFHVVEMRSDDGALYQAALSVPRPPTGQAAVRVQYFVDVLGRDQQVLAAFGDAAQPKLFVVQPEQPEIPWQQNPLLWAGLGAGALLVSSAVVTGVVLSQPLPAPKSSLGEYTLGR